MIIKKHRLSRIICSLLLLTLTGSATTTSPALLAQQPQRERQTTSAPATTNTAPAQTSSPPSTTQNQTTVVSAPVNAPRTVSELRARLDALTHRPELAPAQLAIKVASLETNRVLYETNADKLMVPASNMKMYTVAAALDRLSPDFRFKTSVYAASRPNASGEIAGDLIIYGRGDPSFAASFNDGDYTKAIDDFAARIAAAGVRRVRGDLIGDETYFTGPPFGPGWEWDDLQWDYGAEVSALSVNDNALDLFIKPGARTGDPCIVTLGPATPLMQIKNGTTTSVRGAKRELSVYRRLGENVLEVDGSLPQTDADYTGSVTISQPALLFVSMLRAALERRGVEIKGRTRVIDAPVPGASNTRTQTAALFELTSMQSPPLSVIAAATLKPSQNLYAELILRALGAATVSDPKSSSTEAGIEAVKTFLRGAGIDADALALNDGSGLSRHDLVTASATLQLLTFMSRHRYSRTFYDALPVAGVGGSSRKDGTLRNRMKGTLAAGNVRAKTGTLDKVTSLSGYVTSAAGERLVFSIMLNKHTFGDATARQNYLDAIAVLLASLTGKS
jgi:D-alanyl-D-alanine carboxypeptidase/D-alanyl-D-alanine-endopeptidase (penicillin-binding protein 4)